MRFKKLSVAVAGAVLAALAGCSLPHVNIEFGGHQGPTSSPSQVVPTNQVKSIDDLTNAFPGCAPWENDDTQYAKVRLSNRCGILVGTDGLPGYADDKLQKIKESGGRQAGYFVNGDTWAAVTTSESMAQYLANLYNATYEEL